MKFALMKKNIDLYFICSKYIHDVLIYYSRIINKKNHVLVQFFVKELLQLFNKNLCYENNPNF